METEAKYSFRDRAAFEAWPEREAIGRFRLGPPRTKQVADEYLDTDSCRCLAAGYACRLRHSGNETVATLKSLADSSPGAEASVRRRDELEVTLAPPAKGATHVASRSAPRPNWQQPEAWPQSEARTLALRLARGRPLRHLVTIHQQRQERELFDGDRLVAVQSLDLVRFDAGGPMYELEVELTGSGTDADMSEIVAALNREAVFAPVHGSKLQQALAGIEPPTARALAGRDGLVLARLPGELDRRIARSALRLFAATVHDDHGASGRKLLHALLEELARGRVVNAGHPAAAARDIIAARPLPAGDGDRAIVAAALALLTRQMDPSDDSSSDERPFAWNRELATGSDGRGWSPISSSPNAAARDRPLRRNAMERGRGEVPPGALAAVVAVAMRLHESGVGGSRITAITGTERRTRLTLTGPAADHDARAAEELEPIWQQQFGVGLRCVVPEPGERVTALGLAYDLPLAVAGRIILRNQFARLEACRQGVRDDDPEALHDARVAVRRMRTALRLLRPAYVGRELRPVLAGLKQTGDRLGAVRDLDVLMQRVRDERHLLADPASLDGLLERWEERRGGARQELFAYLDGGYRAVSEQLDTFIEEGGTGAKGEERVCDELPRLIWRRYGVIRAYQPRVATARVEELHQLRKDAKQLRYLLEFFRELLGKRSKRLIDQIVAMQDALGELHDSVVLSELLDRQIAEGDGSPGVAEYRLRSLAAIAEHRRTFESLWPDISGRRFRKRLARAASV